MLNPYLQKVNKLLRKSDSGIEVQDKVRCEASVGKSVRVIVSGKILPHPRQKSDDIEWPGCNVNLYRERNDAMQ